MSMFNFIFIQSASVQDIIDAIGKIFIKFWYWLWMCLDTLVYNLICWVTEMFYYLAGGTFFDSANFNELVARLYTILGLVMLFVLAYSLLRAIINPEEFSKGEKSFGKIAMNVIISIALIAFTPTIFDIATNFQNAILMQGTIEKLILSNIDDEYTEGSEDSNTTYLQTGGRDIAFYTFESFFTPDMENGENADCSTIDDCRNNISNDDGTILGNVDEAVLKESSFDLYKDFIDVAVDGRIKYIWGISTIAGVFIVYVLLNFCFDMALRVIKLFFYELIAPIPIICRILPGGKMKDVFHNWVHQIVSIYLEVFFRIMALSLGIYLIRVVIDNKENITGMFGDAGALQGLLCLALIILSCVTFIRHLPKLLGDLFHLDTGGMKLGLREKFAEGGAFAALGIGGAVATAGVRNLVHAGYNTVNNVRKARANGQRGIVAGARGVVRGAGSTIAGAVSGGVHSGRMALHAKNFHDTRDAASHGASVAATNRSNREAYRVRALMDTYGDAQPRGTFRNLWAVGTTHATDLGRSAQSFVGMRSSYQDLQDEKKVADQMKSYWGELEDLTKDDELVQAYEGMLQATREKEVSSTIFDEAAYNSAISAKATQLRKDAKYKGLTDEKRKEIAKGMLDRNQYVRQRTDEEIQAAVEQRASDIKKYKNLADIARIRAVNKGIADGKQGYITVGAKMEQFYNQYSSSYDFVADMRQLSSVKWEDKWDEIMKSGKADDIDKLLSDFKNTDDPSKDMFSVYTDYRKAKNRSDELSTEIERRKNEERQRQAPPPGGGGAPGGGGH